MTIPTRHVADFFAAQHLVAVDKVFEDLVEGVTDVELSVGVGRAVVEDEQVAWVIVREAIVYFLICPKFLQFWFALGGVGAHIKLGFGQIYRVFVRFSFHF